MAVYCLDTNHVTAYLDGREPITSRIDQAKGEGHQFGITTIVLGEALYVALIGLKPEARQERIVRFLEWATLWDFDRTAAEEYSRLLVEQRRKGQPIPPTDGQIAAVARVHGLIVLTDDEKHFPYIEGLRVENWLREAGET